MFRVTLSRIADLRAPRDREKELNGLNSAPLASADGSCSFIYQFPLIPPLTLTPMVAAKSVPRNHLPDPFEAALRPPPGETPAQRDARILAEHLAKQVSDAIDEQLRVERAELKKSSPEVRILLLGQSESGKSTTLKRMYSISLSGVHWEITMRSTMSAYIGHPHTSAYTFASLTRFTEFQLLHTPAAFQAERVAWRFVIYLNLIRSVRRCDPVVTPTQYDYG